MDQSTVTEWIEELRGGRETAAQKLWDHFLLKLTNLVCKRLRATSRIVGDEEDVVLEVCDACFRGLKEGRFPDIKNRNDLWALLATIAERRAIDQIRRSTKGVEGFRANASFKVISDSSSVVDGIHQWPCSEPTPEFAVIFAESLREQLGVLKDQHADVAILKMQGFTNREIGERIGRSVASVERYLKTIRTTWTSESVKPA